MGLRDNIRPQQLVLRCYAEKAASGQWQAFCLDFDLAAQADTFEAARVKLDAMMSEYVYDALAGEVSGSSMLDMACTATIRRACSGLESLF